MTEAEQERAAVVAWLRGGANFQGSIWDRLRAAWFILAKPRVVCFSMCLQLSDAIERGNHLTK
jgi:hypothetical protein